MSPRHTSTCKLQTLLISTIVIYFILQSVQCHPGRGRGRGRGRFRFRAPDTVLSEVYGARFRQGRRQSQRQEPGRIIRLNGGTVISRLRNRNRPAHQARNRARLQELYGQRPATISCSIDPVRLTKIIKDAELATNDRIQNLGKIYTTTSTPFKQCETPDCLAQANNQPSAKVYNDLQWKGILQEIIAIKLQTELGLDAKQLKACLRRSESITSTTSPTTAPGAPTKLSQIILSCPWQKPVTCDKHAKYRSADGKCNNLEHKHHGGSIIPMERLVDAEYDDYICTPRTKAKGSAYRHTLPNVRVISRKIHKASTGANENKDLTHMNMMWGQFVDHDITLTPMQKGPGGKDIACCENKESLGEQTCFTIKIHSGDPLNRTCMNFVRSAAAPKFKCGIDQREQINEITAWMDASMVYGSTKEEQQHIRVKQDGTPEKKGKIVLSEGFNLPKSPNGHRGCIKEPPVNPAVSCLAAGDKRALEHTGLTVTHTMFARWHNILVAELQQINPGWTDNQLFEEARRIVYSTLQIVTYRDWLPLMLGQKTMHRYGLTHNPSGHTYDVYDSNESPNIVNSFATASFRFGHSMMKDHLDLVDHNFADSTPYRFQDVFFKVGRMYEPGVPLKIMRGMCSRPTQTTDANMADQMTNHLFEKKGKGLDLAALNLQRGRDHGLPDYVKFRKFCKLPMLRSLGDLKHLKIMRPEIADRFSSVYGNIHDIDLWSAGISEIPLEGAQVGPTFACLLGIQFRKIKTADRFWWDNARQPHPFTLGQLEMLRTVTLSKVLCVAMNIDPAKSQALTTLPYDVFKMAHKQGNKLYRCDEIGKLNLEPWRDPDAQ